MTAWTFARQCLHLTAEEFWDLTYEEFAALCDRYNEVEKRWDLRFGVVTSGYVNCHLKQGAQSIPPGRWFGHEQPAEDMSDEQMLTLMKAFSEAHNEGLES